MIVLKGGTSKAGELERGIRRRVTLRIMPFIMLCYFVAYLDLVNAGFVALQMNHALGLTATEYGFGASLFFLGYCVCEIPPNLLFLAAIPVSGIIGAPLSGQLLALDGVARLQGWQWLCSVETLPAVILATIVLTYLQDSPSGAHWVPSKQREWAPIMRWSPMPHPQW